MLPENETLDACKGMTALLTIKPTANDAREAYKNGHIKPVKLIENTLPKQINCVELLKP